MLRPLQEGGAGVRPKERQLLDAVRVTKAAETGERAEALLTHFLHDILRHMYPPMVSVEAAAEMQQVSARVSWAAALRRLMPPRA